MLTRREFTATLSLALVLAPRRIKSQVVQSFSGPMQEDAYRRVSLPAKPGATASMSDDERDELEHKIKCQCGCPLDVYTCRTTDFACSVSPAMHGDVLRLVGGGYGATEILRAFRDVYGERVLMSPPRVGFNWLGYIMPFITLAAGAVAVAMVLYGWRPRAATVAAPVVPAPIDASAEEIEKLQAAVRRDA